MADVDAAGASFASLPFGEDRRPTVASGNPLAPVDERCYLAFMDGSRTWGLSSGFLALTWARDLWHDIDRFLGMRVLIDSYEEELVPADKLLEIARRLHSLADTIDDDSLRQEMSSTAEFLESAVAAESPVWFIF